MTRFLPIFLLLATCYLLLTTSAFAQEITPTVTPATQINPQAASAWEDFLKNLIPAQFKQVPDTLENINRSQLPLEVGEGISNKTNSAVAPQAASDGKQDIVANAAGQYTIASGGRTPPEVSGASTNIFLNFFASIAKAFGSIFDKGEKEAKNFAGTVVPLIVTEQEFTQLPSAENSFAQESPNVLGTQSQKSAAMEKSLPFVQCSELPSDLCGADNKLNIVQ